MNIKQTKKGWNVVKGDTHLSEWIEENNKLDHDEFLIPLACSYLKESDTVIDCGAMYGDHTIAYSRSVKEKGMVIAVEPGKLSFECLKSNIELFPYKNVFALQAAIGELEGETVKHIPRENLGASRCEMVDEKIEGETYLFTVTLDFIAQQSQRKINFCKLDVEGWEVKALIGFSKTLQKDKPILLIEVNSKTLEKQGDVPEDIYEILDFHGYNWKICEPQCSIDDLEYNIICTPKESMP